jgi:hypothetical protein
MTLFNYIQLNYQLVCSHENLINLTEQEWTTMIKQFTIQLAEKPVGLILTNKLIGFIERGYKIQIQNHDFSYSNTIYPKIKYVNEKTALIVVPSIPYFTSIDTVKLELCKDITDKFFINLIKVLNYQPGTFKLDFSQYKYLLSPSKQTGFISLAHELIHCLRNWECINSNNFDNSNEEDNTIYGINGSVLQYHDGKNIFFITENSIRKEWGMNPRVTHDCIELFCAQVKKTHVNANNYTKKNFYECV